MDGRIFGMVIYNTQGRRVAFCYIFEYLTSPKFL